MTDQSLAAKIPSENLAGSPWPLALSPWDEAKVGHLFRVVNGSTPKSSVEEYWDGNVPWATPVDVQEVGDKWLRSTDRSITEKGYESCGTNLVPRGSIILTTRAPIGKLAVAGTDICTNQGCKSLVPIQSVNSQFYFYCLSAARQYLEILGEGATFSELGTDELKRLRLPRPSVDEQDQIASFLDRRTARIDALVAKQKRLLDSLDEKREAFITRAVTAGLDSTVATKSTEVDWIGEIPTHWEPIRLKFLLTEIEQGWSPQCKDRPAGPDQWGVLKAGAANKGRFHKDENKILPSDTEPKPEYEIQQGDLLMNRASGSPEFLGSVALVPEIRSQLLLCDKLFRLHVREDVASPEFLSISLRSHPLRHQIIAAISGAEGLANNLPQAEVKELTLAVPPLAEQKQITESVLDREARVESLMQKVKRAIDLLEEKRQALITAAVTGQIDVTEGRGEPQDVPT